MNSFGKNNTIGGWHKWLEDICRFFINGMKVRTYGGNGSDVRAMYRRYKNMTKNDFLSIHPNFTEVCKSKFELSVRYSGNPETCGIHIVDAKKKMSTIRSGFSSASQANDWAIKNLPAGEVCLFGQEVTNPKAFRYFVLCPEGMVTNL